MKKITAMILVLIVVLLSFGVCSADANAVDQYSYTTIEYLDNGYYIETTIRVESVTDSQNTRGTKTSTKTRSYKNNAGDVMCSLSITGTFSYNGSSATCTSCYHSYTAPGSTWEVLNPSSSRSGNSATATATARHHLTVSYADYPMSVTILCSANGTIS